MIDGLVAIGAEIWRRHLGELKAFPTVHSDIDPMRTHERGKYFR